MDIRDETIAGVLELIAPRGTAAPVFFDSPHSGAEYPTDFRPAAPMALIRRAEDAWIDEVFESAPSQGATLLKALFPRAYLDPNRDAGDIDPALLDQAWPGKINPGTKTAEGHGLVWRLVGAEAEPLYDRKLTVAEVQ
ncbi:MAG: N-formylglutamate amidohydrolase, partial [Alphaproteobacteria bacterium]|nr:N-formylglutamate amidohydrolase [Alphaproteobacteria bacterium]